MRNGEQNAGEHQHQRRLDPRGDQLQDVDLVEDRLAHFAVAEVANEVEILKPDRLVEAVLLADLRDRRGRRPGAEQDAAGSPE